MKEKIQELIQFHKTAKEECLGLLGELNAIGQGKLEKQDRDALEKAVAKAEEEATWRGVFISQLEDLL
jgi:DNA-binding protein H-NS